jgi:hypothetical protein
MKHTPNKHELSEHQRLDSHYAPRHKADSYFLQNRALHQEQSTKTNVEVGCSAKDSASSLAALSRKEDFSAEPMVIISPVANSIQLNDFEISSDDQSGINYRTFSRGDVAHAQSVRGR